MDESSVLSSDSFHIVWNKSNKEEEAVPVGRFQRERPVVRLPHDVLPGYPDGYRGVGITGLARQTLDKPQKFPAGCQELFSRPVHQEVPALDTLDQRHDGIDALAAGDALATERIERCEGFVAPQNEIALLLHWHTVEFGKSDDVCEDRRGKASGANNGCKSIQHVVCSGQVFGAEGVRPFVGVLGPFDCLLVDHSAQVSHHVRGQEGDVIYHSAAGFC